MHRVRHQSVGVTGIWIGGRIGVAPPRHHPVDTVEAATSSDGAVPPSGSAASASGDAVPSSGDAASPMEQQPTSVRVTTWLMSIAPPIHNPSDTGEAATSSDGDVPSRGSAASPSGRAASPIAQQLKRVRVTTRAGAINHTSDSTPVHRDPETDTDDDI